MRPILFDALEHGDQRVPTDCQPRLRGDLHVFRDTRQQEAGELSLVFDVGVFLSLRDFEQRRLGDEQMSPIDHLAHVPEEESQDEGADVRAVDVGVRHDDDLVIAQFLDREIACAYARPQGRDHHADLFGREHFVEPGLLHVEDLPLEREDGLEAPVASLLGRAAGRVPLDEIDLGELRIALLTVCQFSRECSRVEGSFTPRQIARFPSSFTGARGIDDLFDDALHLARVFLEVFSEALVHHLLDPGFNVGRDELVFGLRGKFRVANFY